MRPDWYDQAACRGRSELFYPTEQNHIQDAVSSRGTPYRIVQGEHKVWRFHREDSAKRICAHCPVLRECREISRDETDGIWGGLTPHERGFRSRGHRIQEANEATG